MKTIVKSKSNQQLDSLWVSLALMLFFTIFVSVALHIRPQHIIELIEDFATHHFVLMVMFLFFISLLVIRYYYKNTSSKSQIKIVRGKPKVAKRTGFVNQLRSKVNLEYQTLKCQQINVRQIEYLSFKDIDVLNSNELKVKREEDLVRAMRLGNSYKEKIKIYFKDSVSNKYIYTTVWYVSSTHVTLKHGAVIPVNSIYQVKF